MSVLFLLEAAKITDQAFYAASHSTAHTVHSAKRDIYGMVEHLLEKKVTTQTEGRHSSFNRPNGARVAETEHNHMAQGKTVCTQSG